MRTVRFTLRQVRDYPDFMPPRCVYCGSAMLNRHGSVKRRISDLYIQEVTAHRYRYTDCRRTFRHYPDGVDGCDQSLRLRGMPQTHNCTERTIGRSKIRYKTVRGYKSEGGVMNGLGLAQ